MASTPAAGSTKKSAVRSPFIALLDNQIRDLEKQTRSITSKLNSLNKRHEGLRDERDLSPLPARGFPGDRERRSVVNEEKLQRVNEADREKLRQSQCGEWGSGSESSLIHCAALIMAPSHTGRLLEATTGAVLAVQDLPRALVR